MRVLERFNIDSRVRKLLQVTNVALVEQKVHPEYHKMMPAPGTYDSILDVVCLNPTLMSAREFDDRGSFEEIILHELIHWTGHSSRLNRSAIALGEKIDASMNEAGGIGMLIGLMLPSLRATEEATAQLGMLELVKMLGFEDLPKYIEMTQNYLELIATQVGPINLPIAEEQAKQAAAFLLNKYLTSSNDNSTLINERA